MIRSLISILLALCIMLSLPLQAAEPTSGAEGPKPYFEIEEPFTINFLNQSQEKMRYLQISVALKSDDPAIINNAEMNLPMIQDALRVLFTDQDYQTVSTVTGREQLQQAALEKISQILERETGSDGLEAVYFTRFILQ
ncbi:flagellar basal body-associated FliL family protein [uncultured Methylophaga sp.]|uniref:flagellar basal body-associated FliL family protein n=1 Tax=uncultured Methylophaga sp. TaxID=285271 RepID=UPI00260D5268|nr:flagellar basal body-associated FliL family protein [uncultured Methylophaga sp.]